MAKGKGRGARDLIYGRRGGHWVDEGHVPGSGVADIAAIRKRAGDNWPLLPDRDGERSAWTPATPDEWAGRARMAAARAAAGQHLDHDDREALRRTTVEVAS